MSKRSKIAAWAWMFRAWGVSNKDVRRHIRSWKED